MYTANQKETDLIFGRYMKKEWLEKLTLTGQRDAANNIPNKSFQMESRDCEREA